MPEEHATREERAQADLGRGPAPPQPHRVRRHQRAPRHRRHDDPHPPLRPDLRHRRRPQDRTATRIPSASARPEPSAQLAGTPRTKLYLHLDRTDLDETRVGRAEKLGPATAAKIRDWVGHSRVTIQPVLRIDRTDAVDAHDPPAWMRDLVILRDPRCVFPHCQRDARGCDLDHIDPLRRHRPTRPNPTSQPRPAVPRHHRAKTTGRWQYRRLPDGTYQWTGPGITG